MRISDWSSDVCDLGCPPGLSLSETEIQPWLDKRRPGQSRYTTQRPEPDRVRILSGVFEGRTTGTPISPMMENVDHGSKDYTKVAKAFRPAHAAYASAAKYRLREFSTAQYSHPPATQHRGDPDAVRR